MHSGANDLVLFLGGNCIWLSQKGKNVDILKHTICVRRNIHKRKEVIICTTSETNRAKKNNEKFWGWFTTGVSSEWLEPKDFDPRWDLNPRPFTRKTSSRPTWNLYEGWLTPNENIVLAVKIFKKMSRSSCGPSPFWESFENGSFSAVTVAIDD